MASWKPWVEGCFVLLLLAAFGCVTAPSGPGSRVSPQDFVGTWRGPMTVSADADTGHESQFKPSAELRILDAGLRGRLTLLLSEDGGKEYPFRGSLEGEELVAHWKGGRWMKLKLRANGTRLEGPYDFVKVGGFVTLSKLPP